MGKFGVWIFWVMMCNDLLDFVSFGNRGSNDGNCVECVVGWDKIVSGNSFFGGFEVNDFIKCSWDLIIISGVCCEIE